MRWTVWGSFAAFCILSGSSWVVPPAMGDGLPSLEQQGLLFGVIGLTALLFSGRGMRARRGGLQLARIGAGAIAFFGVPMVVVEYAGASVSSITRSALFAMVPVVVGLVVAAGDTGTREERGARRSLVPALVGVGGLLLILPMQFSGSLRGRVMLALVCAAVVLAGFASVWLYRSLGEVSLSQAIAVVGIANAVFLLIWSAVHEDMVWQWRGLVSVVSISSGVDLLEVLLIVWLLRTMEPIRFAARYLVIPMVTILESFAFVRPQVTVRIGFGTALLVAGAGMLLFLKGGEEETVLLLR
jgi:drug/metabolite transporter (DMT)-like permease